MPLQLEKVNAELQNTLQVLRTRSKELQELRDEMQDLTEEKDQKNKENQVMRDELKQLGQDLQQILSFLTQTGKIHLQTNQSGPGGSV